VKIACLCLSPMLARRLEIVPDIMQEKV
jgi:hypothetical protein